jgi:putative transposase
VLSHVGHKIARSTIAAILELHGLEPAPERSRKTTWKEFLARHWELIVAADFFTVEVWTRRGLQRFVVLFFLDLSTRQVETAGLASVANGLWMSQIGRRTTNVVDGILVGKRYLIHDRDPLFTAEFLNLLAGIDVESAKLPPRSPNLNAYAERFVRTVKESCLDRVILFGEGSLRKAVSEFMAHDHTERHHQDLGNRLLHPEASHLRNTGMVQRRERLGGMQLEGRAFLYSVLMPNPNLSMNSELTRATVRFSTMLNKMACRDGIQTGAKLAYTAGAFTRMLQPQAYSVGLRS